MTPPRSGDYSQARFRGARGLVAQMAKQNAALRELSKRAHPVRAGDILEDLVGNRIVSPENADVAEPTAADFSGWFLSAALQALADGNFGLANVLAGQVIYGIGDAGEFLRGIDFLSRHYATLGAYSRIFRRGFKGIGGYPFYQMEFMGSSGGAEIITSNPGFESGDFTGFTTSDTVAGASWAVSTASPYAGTYCALFHPVGATGTATIYTSKYAITASSRYTFSVRTKFLTTSGLVIQAKWYDAGSSLVQTDTIFSGTGTLTGWLEKASTLLAPATATQVEFYVTITFAAITSKSSGILYLDAFSIVPVGEYSYISFEDDDVYAGNGTAKISLLTGNTVRATDTDSRTSTTTLANDTKLKFAGKANAIYWVELILVLTGNGVGDFNFGWTYPSGVTMLWQGSTEINNVEAAATPTAALIETSTLAVGSGVGTTFLAKLAGLVIMSSTAGDVNLAWAQNTSNGTASQRLPNSVLIYRKIG